MILFRRPLIGFFNLGDVSSSDGYFISVIVSVGINFILLIQL